MTALAISMLTAFWVANSTALRTGAEPSAAIV